MIILILDLFIVCRSDATAHAGYPWASARCRLSMRIEVEVAEGRGLLAREAAAPGNT